MISVLHILNEIRPSGAEVMIKIAALYWHESGVVLHALSTGKEKGNYADVLSKAGIVVHHLPFSNSIKFYLQIINLIRSNHFDVVHIHTEHAALTYASLAHLAGVPKIIRTIHNNFLFTGITKFSRALRRRIMRQLGTIQVSIADSVQQNEQNRFGNPTYLIYNWYDDTHFRPPSLQERLESRKMLGVRNDQKILVSIGNCAQVKNHIAIIQALALMKKDSNTTPLYWHIGDEDGEKKERLLAEQLGIDIQVQFWGRQNDVRPFLWAADVFVMPSFYEGFSIAMLEALASEVHLVLARSPGLEQWATIFPEITYVNTDSGDLARGIIQALMTSKDTIGKNSTLVKGRFSAERGTKEYFMLYQAMVNKNVF